MVRIHQIFAFQDNYIYLLEDGAKALVIDAGETSLILSMLTKKNLQLTHILTTHHHWDHVEGNQELSQKTGASVLGFAQDSYRIPCLSHPIQKDETFHLLGLTFHALYTPGHTLGHISFYVPALKALFCGDTLFGLGCGRLFEGSPQQMWSSLQRLCTLPEDTLVFCAHEYTLQNGLFARSLDPKDYSLAEYVRAIAYKRKKNQPTVPSLLKDEKKYNPFLKANSWHSFADLRKRKDAFS